MSTNDLPSVPFDEHDAVVQAIAEVALGAGADPDVLGDLWDVNDTIEFLSGYVTDMEKMKATAARFAKAHRAAMLARNALSDYWRGAWAASPEAGHGFRTCMRFREDGSVVIEECEICAASWQVYAAKVEASKERGNALQALVRLMLKEPKP